VNGHQQVVLMIGTLGEQKPKTNLSPKKKRKKRKRKSLIAKNLASSNKPKPREKQLEQEKKKKSRKAGSRHKLCNPARHKC
jgi:hypothetical protein